MHIHPDILEREKLLCSLLNMRKKPNKKERSLIISGIYIFHSNSFFIMIDFFFFFFFRFVMVFKILK